MLTPRETAALECCRANLDVLGNEPNVSYLASAALWEFLGAREAGYAIKKVANGHGEHFWVANQHGTIIDPIYDGNGDKPPYRYGKNCPKRNNLTKHLPLLQTLKETLSGDERIALRVSTHDIVGRPLSLEKTSPLSEEQEHLLADAWRALIKEWADRPDEFLRCYYSKGALALQFVQSLLYGDDIPRTATLAYVPDRFYTAGSHRPFNEVLKAALERSQELRGLRYAMVDQITFSKLVATAAMPICGYRIPGDFPISLARDLINRHCPAGGSVLDPCHGWGGRLVGFMLSRAGRYVGIDPAPHSPNLREMFEDLSQYLPEPKRCKLINKPFEDVELTPESYDFAMTSPPYFNLEKYHGEESSWRRYTTLEDWYSKFYRTLIYNVAEALKPGAALALQVTPKLKMVDRAREYAAEAGLTYEKTNDTAMRRYNSASADRDGATDLFEVVAIFRKGSK